jgi:erythromycin esterase-like protein
VVVGATSLARAIAAIAVALFAAPLVAAAAPSWTVDGGCRDGRAQGPYQLRGENGQLRVSGAFNEGTRTGSFIFWRESGVREAHVPYDDRGLRNGTVATWYAGPPGQEPARHVESAWHGGRRDGETRTWHPDGHRRSQTVYVDGRIASSVAWSDDGTPLAPAAAREQALRDERAADAEYAARDALITAHPAPCGPQPRQPAPSLKATVQPAEEGRAMENAFAALGARAATAIDATDALDEIAARAAHASIVLIGEASHGTLDFYAMRAAITRRLITDHGFRAVALEADWPDTFRVHRFVTGRSDDEDATEALSDFRRFPAWMWRNETVREFVDWLAERNRARQPGERVGVFGLDLYSLYGSIESVLAYLDRVDPAAAKRARARYRCFEYFGDDPQGYALAVMQGVDSCEDAAVAQLVELRRHAMLPLKPARGSDEEIFSAEQNARLIVNAERYSRSMYRGRESTWNMRDRHMVETLAALRDRIPGASDGTVVWAHNSHLGDARATEMSERGEVNVAQLVRERYGRDVFSIGFSTYEGFVTAASDWDAPAQRKRVRPGLAGSYERTFHESGHDRFVVDLGDRAVATALRGAQLQRAIGVIYRPDTERWSHYFHARLPEQFDAMIHLDSTAALIPLDRSAGWDEGEPPQTWPSGI